MSNSNSSIIEVDSGLFPGRVGAHSKLGKRVRPECWFLFREMRVFGGMDAAVRQGPTPRPEILAMLIRLTAWAFLVAAILSPTFASAQNNLPETHDLERIGLVNGWWGRAIVDSKQDEIEFLRADEQIILAQSRQGLFTAFRADTGRILWSVLVGGPQYRAFPAAMNESEVIVALGLNMFSLDKQTGETRWTLRLPGHPSCTPEIDSNQVYVGTTDGSVYAYSLRSIRELFGQRKLPAYTHLAQVWRYKTPRLSSPSPPTAPWSTSPANGEPSTASTPGNGRSATRSKPRTRSRLPWAAATIPSISPLRMAA